MSVADRRDFVISLGLAALVVPRLVQAQGGRPVRIGWLAPEPRPIALATFRQELAERGWTEGSNLAIEQRYSRGPAERFPALVAELLRLGSHVLVADGSPATKAAQLATASTPIVFVSGNPVAQGFTVTLARPSANLTGVAIITGDLNPKRVQLLKEAIPTLARLAVLEDSSAVASTVPDVRLRDWEAIESAARQLGIQIAPKQEARRPEDLEGCFARIHREKAGAVLVLPSAFFSAHASQIAALAAKSRVPAVYEHEDFVNSGGLISYGPSPRDIFRRVAGYTDRILRGRTPAELPVEQVDILELVINLKAARALGLSFPQPLLGRAHRVIE